MSGSDLRHALRDALAILQSAARTPIFLGLALMALAMLPLHFWAIDRYGNALVTDGDWLRLDRDDSVSERIEYAMLFATALVLGIVATRQRSAMFLLAALATLFLLADNYFDIHVTAGKTLYPQHARAGEIVFASGVALVAAIVGIGWYRRAAYTERSWMLALGITIGIFAVFAVGVDAAHSVAIKVQPALDAPLGALEDFGEMLSIALLLSVSIVILKTIANQPSLAGQYAVSADIDRH